MVTSPLVRATVTPSLVDQSAPNTPGGLSDYVNAFKNATDSQAKVTAWQGAKQYLNATFDTLKQHYDVAVKSNDNNGMLMAHNSIKSLARQYAENFKSMEQAQAINMRRQQPSATPNQPTIPSTTESPAPTAPALAPKPGLTLPQHVRTV